MQGGNLLMRPAPPAIYLAGGISDWRDHVRARWAHTEVILLDPFVESDQRTLAAFTLDDLKLVERARCVLAYHDYHVYGGLALECGYAAALDRMVVYVCRQPRVDSMIAGVSKGVFTELDPALEFIERKLGLRPRRDGDPRDRWEVQYTAQSPPTREMVEDVIPEGCCHSAAVEHSHDYVVGGPGEMRCCHGHPRSRPVR